MGPQVDARVVSVDYPQDELSILLVFARHTYGPGCQLAVLRVWGSPTGASPAPAGSLTGNWAGTFTPAVAFGTDPQPERVTASFTQNGQAVSGELRIGAGPVAPPTRLTLDGMLTGTQLTATIRSGFCGSSGAASGSLADGVLRLKLPVLKSSNCTFFIEGEVVLQR